MQHISRLASSLSSPALLIVLIWCAALVGVAAGPLAYPEQPSAVVLTIVGVGVFLFALAYYAGVRSVGAWFRRQASMSAPSIRALNNAVLATSLLGIAGIGLMAFDRLVLSGVSNSGYAELLRCAPTLVEFIQIKRTPLLYLGYLTFSFGFVSLMLFLLKGEEIRGWPAMLAQLSIVSPIGYALIYSGRMPILFVIVLIVSAILVRIGQGRRPLPDGHYLFLKMAAVLVLFLVYSSAMWSTRQNFCVQMSPVIRELQQRMDEREREQAAAVQSKPAEPKPAQPKSAEPRPAELKPLKSGQPIASPKPELPAADPIGGGAPAANVRQESALPAKPLPPSKPSSSGRIDAAELSRMIAGERASPLPAPAEASGSPPLSPPSSSSPLTIPESWDAKPRAYVTWAIDSGYLAPGPAASFLSTYFYLTHGIRMVDRTWHARHEFSPRWGVYEVGILSPLFRIFSPQDQRLGEMDRQLKAAGIHGFFPTVWGAAFIDFGRAGAIVYILIWGFVAGGSSLGTKRSALATPPMLLVFVLASIFLSLIQGPLGIANSALVLFSIIVTGLAIDLPSLRAGLSKEKRELKLEALGP